MPMTEEQKKKKREEDLESLRRRQTEVSKAERGTEAYRGRSGEGAGLETRETMKLYEDRPPDRTKVAAGKPQAADSKAEGMTDEELERWQPLGLAEVAAKRRVKQRRALLKSGISASDAANALAARQAAQ